MTSIPQNLKIAYIRSANQKIVTLNKLWDNAVRNNWAPQSVRALQALVFGIKGSGGSYGYPALSDAADRFHQLLKDAESSSTTRSPTVNAAREALQRQLELVARDANTH